MRLKTVRVQNYRSIRDTGEFEIELVKTILVGPNEAGKTAILRAIQLVNPPAGVPGFDVLRDYPRSQYNDITSGKIKPQEVPVVTATFVLNEEDQALLPEPFRGCRYEFTRYLNGRAVHTLLDAPECPTYGEIQKDLLRLAAHIDKRIAAPAEGEESATVPSEALKKITEGWLPHRRLNDESALQGWLDDAVALVDESNATEEGRIDRLRVRLQDGKFRNATLKALNDRLPVFVLYSNYFRVRPVIHLAHLAERLDKNLLDDAQYDYGNSCLLKLLGFTAKELSALGNAEEPPTTRTEQRQQAPHMQWVPVTVPVPQDEYQAALKEYRDKLDNRWYQLNAASVKLTEQIRSIWHPDEKRQEADRLRIQADGQYLKVVVEDELGVEIELDQRSEGFQWLVSFFIVFFAEAANQNENAVLLLNEPGMSLHALKQREFRETISRLGRENQTVYTTHSPFLVGPDELDVVRVVEMTDRTVGTRVHTSVTSSDPAALLPLQEALGYDLAQSLFTQQRNLLVEGLTDLWYLEAIKALLADAKIAILNDKIALVPASTAGKVVYFATILHAHHLKSRS
jgi:hypothetical protein